MHVSDIIASLVLSESRLDQHRAMAAWLKVREAIYSPIVFSTQLSRVLCLTFDRIASDGLSLSSDVVMDILNKTSAQDVRGSLRALAAMEASDSVKQMTPSQVKMIVGTWRNEVDETGSALDMIGGFIGLSDQMKEQTGGLKQMPDLIDSLLGEFRKKRALLILKTCEKRLNDKFSDTEASIDQAVTSLLNKAVSDNDGCEMDNYAMQLVSKTPDIAQLGGIWGIDELDAALPLRKGTVVTLAAPQGGGKTSLGIQVARESKIVGSGVLYVSLEMTRDQLLARMARQMTGVGEMKVMDGTYDDENERLLVKQAFEELATGEEMYIRDGTSYTVEKLKRVVKMECMLHSIDLVVIDHFHRLRPEGKQDSNSHLANAALEIADIAKDNDVCVLNMAQFSKANQDAGHDSNGNKKDAKRPQSSDLRGASELADNTAAIVLLWIRSQEHKTREITACIDKNRFGAICQVPLAFNPSLKGVFTVSTAEQDGGGAEW